MMTASVLYSELKAFNSIVEKFPSEQDVLMLNEHFPLSKRLVDTEALSISFGAMRRSGPLMCR
jgi:hypothetical protein